MKTQITKRAKITYALAIALTLVCYVMTFLADPEMPFIIAFSLVIILWCIQLVRLSSQRRKGQKIEKTS